MVATDDAAPLDAESIVAAAGDLVDRIGPEQLTLTGVAEQLGVTQPALYRHIDGLPDVWRALGLSTRAMLAAELAEAAVGRTGPDAVAAVAHAWRAFGHRHRGRYRSTDRYAVAGDADLERAAHRTIGVLQRVLQGFGLAGDELRHAADTMRSALHGFVAYELGAGHPDPDRIEATFQRLIDHLCVAFAAVGSEAAGGPHEEVDR